MGLLRRRRGQCLGIQGGEFLRPTLTMTEVEVSLPLLFGPTCRGRGNRDGMEWDGMGWDGMR